MNSDSLIQQLVVKNFTRFRSLSGQSHAPLNVIIGENDTGKTHLLKLLYSIVRSLEEYQKKKASSPQLVELLAKKLQWVFLPQKMELGNLVCKGTSRLKVSIQIQGKELQFEFGKSTKTQIKKLLSEFDNLDEVKAIFLPPKEILSISDAIVATREDKEILAFDDTYLDLVRDFRQPEVRHGKVSYREVRHSRVMYRQSVWQALNKAAGESKIMVEKDGSIWFVRGNEKYNVHQIAEGARKIGILHRLMRNDMLSSRIGSVLFVDEPEVNLHPKAMVLLTDFLYQLSNNGVQVYLSTHSYFVLKRLEQLARRCEQDVLLIDLRRKETETIASFSWLKDGLPNNPIAEQSVALYQEDIELYSQKN